MAESMRINRARLAPLGFVSLLVFLSGCTVPLGPGYQLHHETVAIHYRAGTPVVLHVRTEAVVRGFGSRPLDSVRILLPRRFPANSRVNVQLAGRSVPAVPRMSKGRTRLVLPLRSPLSKEQSIRFRLEYTLRLASSEFILEPKDWLAMFLKPAHLFSEGRPWAKKTELQIIVPDGYRVLIGERSPEKHGIGPGGETEYRYMVRRQDFPPFLAVGRFEERKVRSGRREVAFWTLQPLAASCAQGIASHLAITAELYRSDFGSLHKHLRTITVIEVPPGGGSSVWEMSGGFGSVPGGIAFSMAPADLCKQPKSYFAPADRALANTWFGWTVVPEPDARAILTGGAPRYAELLAEEHREGTESKSRQVRAWLGEYDRLRDRAKPLAPIQLRPEAPPAQRRMAGIQSALCLIALQDRFGPGPVRGALEHLVNSLRGSTAGLDDVRSSFEQATGKNLYDFINRWLGRPGIPAAFRRRYTAASPKTADEGSISTLRRAR